MIPRILTILYTHNEKSSTSLNQIIALAGFEKPDNSLPPAVP